ncbi:MAG: succinoglycan biosynthesis protein ExoA [Thermoleophilaceae bacterium]|jgi:GT2 family glycosyltransferase|nr:succinoglycan biosynthesis protein ExoA [Thermoleophilaceae bacterium]
MPVDVSVLTPVLNEENHIREVAAKMLAQRFDGDIEFLFIDGASEDRTGEILRDLQRADPRVRVLQNPKRSTPVSLNIGLASARGAYIARMDAHTLYPEDYLARGVERLRRGGADHVSGPQLARGDGTWSRRVALALETPLGRGGAQFRQAGNGEIEVDSGFTGVWPRSVLEAHSGWDEDWHNDQDSELAARIRGSGGRILCLPEMGAQYIPRDSLSALARQYWRYGTYRAKTSGAHPESMRRSHLFAPSLALSLAAAILPLGRVRRLARTAVALWCAAVVGVAMAEAWRGNSSELDASAADVAALPAVFGAMHLAWGFGFLAGCVRFGPPLRALAHLARRTRA